jgi:hypothetical protein
MEDPNLIQLNYTCKDANCLYTPNAVGVSVSVTLSDYERGNYQAQQCPNCGGEMISDSDDEIQKAMWDAGIKYTGLSS